MNIPSILLVTRYPPTTFIEAKNTAAVPNMIEKFWDKENKVINFDLEDEILKGCVITHQGSVVNESVK